MSNTSIIRYLSIRIILLMLLLMACWITVAKYGYEFALDDSAEHYLYYDAQLIAQQQIELPISDDFKLLTQHQSDLPLPIQQAWRAGLLPVNQVSLVSDTFNDTYVLPWQPASSNAVPIFILHFFDKQDTLPIMPWLLLLLVVLSIPILYIVIRSAFKIHMEINLLTKFVNTNKPPNKQSKFQELSAFFKALTIARQAEHFAQQRERLVSTYLSHEIRTPLTQIQHGTSRLQQLDDLPLEAIEVLQSLALSQHRLTSTCSAVLALWQQDNLATQQLDLRGSIKGVVQKLQTPTQPIKLNLCAFEVIKSIHSELFELLLTQAIENAQQHGEPPLTITLSDDALQLQNPIGDSKQCSSGVGLGSILIEQICQRLNWYQNVTLEGGEYLLTIKFKAAM
ncbi:HAMP domain-containing histidine kinase [Pseudoalteromonas sp. JBTF-M23]|uniref:histidine kinase n=1 Tax=Pseudoalteromonas caenipelagi TaxID=2726988 RepID=A0A849VAV1_9GAMM|nr:HAMP domain-containing histidine kinase [Pseudoalteromonas caenipelagi]NOU50406.1 HAMP domain-containing histidine kinase [Pseudoalteromonas caenipelagi]